MKIGMTLSASRKHSLLDPKKSNIPLDRYKCFREIWGPDNYKILFVDDLQQGLRCPVYSLTEDIKPAPAGIVADCCFDIFLTGTVSPHLGDRLVTLEDVKAQVNYLSEIINHGKIKMVINNLSSLYMEDKAKISRFKEFNIPRTYTTQDKAELTEILEQERVLIAKPRFGDDGNGIERLEKEFRSKSIEYNGLENYIFQQEINYREEIRIIFYDDKILAARTIIDRTRPWEKAGFREHKRESYIPSQDEVADTLQIARRAGLKTGCVDWLVAGERFLLEINGFGTGLGYPEGVYDVNKEFAKLILAEAG